MRMPDEYYDVYIVHVGYQIRDVYTSPDEAIKHAKSMIDSNEPAEFTAGLREFGLKCIKYDIHHLKLTLADARKELAKSMIHVESWKSGRK